MWQVSEAIYSELSDTRKVIPSLLSKDTTKLAADIIAVYIQSAAKIFGTWAIELTTRWDEDDLPEVKQSVESIISAVTELANNPDFEVQERVNLPLCSSPEQK